MSLKDVFILSEKSSVLDLTNNCKDLKVVVVSIIGKSAYKNFGHKVNPLSKMFNSSRNSNNENIIEYYFDEENQVVYLHLYSLLDTVNLVDHYGTIIEEHNKQNKNLDFLSIYNGVKCSYARALLLLFHISHIVILSQPGNTFDINNVQIFKSLDSIRQKYTSQIEEVLKSVPNLSHEWISNGRPCTPRLVFYFEKCPKQFINDQKFPQLNIKKLEHETEDRIYHILRKVRIVGSTSCNSLFAIPANQEFVYINNTVDQNTDRLAFSVERLIKSCQPVGREAIQFPFSCQSESVFQKRSFNKFLKVHIDLAFSKGFDDNVGTGRHCSHPTAYFEIPTLELWMNVTTALYKYFMTSTSTSENAEYNLTLPSSAFSSFYIDTKFSEQRCQKVLPIAVARYQENLPSHYTRNHHDDKLEMALASFATQARGPMYDKYHQELVEKCVKHFESGHQLCEHSNLPVVSKHESDTEHCVGARYVSPCDCGRKNLSEDLLSLKLTNYSYYSNMGTGWDCVCTNMERMVKYPVYPFPTEKLRVTGHYPEGHTIASKSILRSQDQANSEKLSDVSQDCELEHIAPNKSDFSIVQQQVTSTPLDTETVSENTEERK